MSVLLQQSQELEVSEDGVMEPGYRATHFWFKDGSVVLLAEKTMFRVHSSVLSRNSDFFHDMFGVPQPENEPLVEGCPVVIMHDKADDWHNTLMYLYDTSMTALLTCFNTFTLASLMRLANKYQFFMIGHHVPQEFKRDVPKSDFASMTEYMDKNKVKNIANLINIAVELNIRFILPVSYYLCATHFTTHQIMHGVPGGYEGDIRLASETQQLVLVGRDKLDLSIRDHLMKWLLEPLENGDATECSSPAKCGRVRGKYMTKYSKQVGVERYRWVECVPGDFQDRFCEKCSTAVKHQRDLGTTAFWTVLPSCFELPDWKKLRDFEN